MKSIIAIFLVLSSMGAFAQQYYYPAQPQIWMDQNQYQDYNRQMQQEQQRQQWEAQQQRQQQMEQQMEQQREYQRQLQQYQQQQRGW